MKWDPVIGHWAVSQEHPLWLAAGQEEAGARCRNSCLCKEVKKKERLVNCDANSKLSLSE